MGPHRIAQLKKPLSSVCVRFAEILDRVDASVLDRFGADDLRDYYGLQTMRLVLHAEAQWRDAAVGGKD